MTILPRAFFAAALLATPAIAGDADDIRAQIAAFETAFNAGDSAGVAALYTEDAIALPPGGPVIEGREAIGGMWQGAIDGGFKDLKLNAMEIEVVGDAAHETGTFDGMAGEAPALGKYIVVWKKVDGTWLLHRDIWNDRPAE